MARTSKLDLESALAGLLALTVADRDERVKAAKVGRRSELVLADAGLSAEQIAPLVNKSVGAVKKAVERDRKAAGGTEGEQ